MKEEIELALTKAFLGDNPLYEPIKYALSGGGKRIRPLIVHMVAEGLGYGLDVMHAALATEFFHSSSLIADDLPCMDNDDFRRERPTLHREYGEGVALLTSYALISEAFHRIYLNGEVMKRSGEPFSFQALEATTIALECASRCAGVNGATLGQYHDLYSSVETKDAIEEVIYLKTITLFEGSFVLGWVFGGGDFLLLDQVKELAYHFGMAFQIRDDLEDISQDKERAGHSNYALALGEERARIRFFEEMENASFLLDSLDINTKAFDVLKLQLSLLVQQPEQEPQPDNYP